MADVEVKPAFVSTYPSSPDSTKIDGPRWNAARLFSGGNDGEVVARDSASATGASWRPFVSTIPVSSYDDIPVGQAMFFFGGTPLKFAVVYNDNGIFREMSITIS